MSISSPDKLDDSLELALNEDIFRGSLARVFTRVESVKLQGSSRLEKNSDFKFIMLFSFFFFSYRM